MWSTSRLSKNSRGNIKDFARNSVWNIFHANIDVHSRRLIAEFPWDGIKYIEKIKSHCANITFSYKNRYGRIFQQVTHKGGGSAMNYIKIFQNAQDFYIPLGNTYSEDQLMHIFLDNFHLGGKCSGRIASNQAER